MTKPKPISDPHTGQYQVVVSFRVETNEDKNGDPDLIEAFVHNRLGRMKDLTVHVRKIGAGGERSEFEGTVGALANLDDVQHVRATTDVQAKDKRL